MSKETDKRCQLCLNFDTCSEELGSQGCQQYQFYKCKGCIDRVVESDGIPRCFRGGMPCAEIQYCSIGDR